MDLNENEKLHLDRMASAHQWQEIGQIADVAGQVLPLIGDFDVGASGWASSPVVKWRWGGLNLAQAAQATHRRVGVAKRIPVAARHRAPSLG